MAEKGHTAHMFPTDEIGSDKANYKNRLARLLTNMNIKMMDTPRFRFGNSKQKSNTKAIKKEREPCKTVFISSQKSEANNKNEKKHLNKCKPGHRVTSVNRNTRQQRPKCTPGMKISAYDLWEDKLTRNSSEEHCDEDMSRENSKTENRDCVITEMKSECCPPSYKCTSKCDHLATNNGNDDCEDENIDEHCNENKYFDSCEIQDTTAADDCFDEEDKDDDDCSEEEDTDDEDCDDEDQYAKYVDSYIFPCDEDNYDSDNGDGGEDTDQEEELEDLIEGCYSVTKSELAKICEKYIAYDEEELIVRDDSTLHEALPFCDGSNQLKRGYLESTVNRSHTIRDYKALYGEIICRAVDVDIVEDASMSAQTWCLCTDTESYKRPVSMDTSHFYAGGDIDLFNNEKLERDYTCRGQQSTSGSRQGETQRRTMNRRSFKTSCRICPILTGNRSNNCNGDAELNTNCNFNGGLGRDCHLEGAFSQAEVYYNDIGEDADFGNEEEQPLHEEDEDYNALYDDGDRTYFEDPEGESRNIGGENDNPSNWREDAAKANCSCTFECANDFESSLNDSQFMCQASTVESEVRARRENAFGGSSTGDAIVARVTDGINQLLNRVDSTLAYRSALGYRDPELNPQLMAYTATGDSTTAGESALPNYSQDLPAARRADDLEGPAGDACVVEETQDDDDEVNDGDAFDEDNDADVDEDNDADVDENSEDEDDTSEECDEESEKGDDTSEEDDSDEETIDDASTQGYVDVNKELCKGVANCFDKPLVPRTASAVYSLGTETTENLNEEQTVGCEEDEDNSSDSDCQDDESESDGGDSSDQEDDDVGEAVRFGSLSKSQEEKDAARAPPSQWNINAAAAKNYIQNAGSWMWETQQAAIDNVIGSLSNTSVVSASSSGDEDKWDNDDTRADQPCETSEGLQLPHSIISPPAPAAVSPKESPSASETDKTPRPSRWGGRERTPLVQRASAKRTGSRKNSPWRSQSPDTRTLRSRSNSRQKSPPVSALRSESPLSQTSQSAQVTPIPSFFDSTSSAAKIESPVEKQTPPIFIEEFDQVVAEVREDVQQENTSNADSSPENTQHSLESEASTANNENTYIDSGSPKTPKPSWILSPEERKQMLNKRYGKQEPKSERAKTPPPQRYKITSGSTTPKVDKKTINRNKARSKSRSRSRTRNRSLNKNKSRWGAQKVKQEKMEPVKPKQISKTSRWGGQNLDVPEQPTIMAAQDDSKTELLARRRQIMAAMSSRAKAMSKAASDLLVNEDMESVPKNIKQVKHKTWTPNSINRSGRKSPATTRGKIYQKYDGDEGVVCMESPFSHLFPKQPEGHPEVKTEIIDDKPPRASRWGGRSRQNANSSTKKQSSETPIKAPTVIDERKQNVSRLTMKAKDLAAARKNPWKPSSNASRAMAMALNENMNKNLTRSPRAVNDASKKNRRARILGEQTTSSPEPELTTEIQDGDDEKPKSRSKMMTYKIKSTDDVAQVLPVGVSMDHTNSIPMQAAKLYKEPKIEIIPTIIAEPPKQGLLSKLNPMRLFYAVDQPQEPQIVEQMAQIKDVSCRDSSPLIKGVKMTSEQLNEHRFYNEKNDRRDGSADSGSAEDCGFVDNGWKIRAEQLKNEKQEKLRAVRLKKRDREEALQNEVVDIAPKANKKKPLEKNAAYGRAYATSGRGSPQQKSPKKLSKWQEQNEEQISRRGSERRRPVY